MSWAYHRQDGIAVRLQTSGAGSPSTSPTSQVTLLSSRADMVSSNDALVSVALPAGTDAS